MRLKNLILEDFDDDEYSDVNQRSQAASDAENRGLVDLGWGRWGDPNEKDPQTGHMKTVAKTVNGKLVKVNDVTNGDEGPVSIWSQNQPRNDTVTQSNPDRPPSDDQPSHAPPMPPQKDPTAKPQSPLSHANNGDDAEEDSYVAGVKPGVIDNDPLDNQEPPEFKGGLQKLLSLAGGDPLELRKSLVKQFRNGNKKAAMWINKLDDYEEERAQHMRDAVKRVNDRHQKRHDDLRAKYDARFPSPKI